MLRRAQAEWERPDAPAEPPREIVPEQPDPFSAAEDEFGAKIAALTERRQRARLDALTDRDSRQALDVASLRAEATRRCRRV